MSIFLDIATVAILAYIIYRSYKKGLVRVIIEVIGYLASLIIAYFLSSSVGGWIYTLLLKPVVSDHVSDAISQQTAAQSSQLASQLSGYAQFFSLGGGDPNQVIGDALKAGGGSATNTIMDTLVAPVLMSVGRIIAFVIIFAICMIVVRLIARAADVVFKIPLIRQINELGGAAVGAVKAVLVMFVVCTLVTISLPIFSMQEKPPITNNTIDSTYVFKYIYQVNPLTQLLLKK